MESSNRIIQSFWTGPFTTMERLCAVSFLKNGHEFHLYAYEPLVGVPEGVVMKDANEIMPREKVSQFQHAQHIADYFRVLLLLKRGGWYVDCDQICLMPFNFKSEYVFVKSTKPHILETSPIKVPAESPLMQRYFEEISQMRPEELGTMGFQAIGPELFGRLVPELKLSQHALPRITFDPVRWNNASKIVDPSVRFNICASYAVHLFHAIWNQGVQSWDHPTSPDTDGKYPEGCLYEILKKRYGV